MGRKSKWYHSEVQVEDIGFQPVFVYDLNIYKPIIKEFNEAKTRKEKQEIALKLPKELFTYCRFCGKPVVNTISKLECHKDNSISFWIPSVQYRIIDGKKYELSCCEECLLEHFKNCPPKSPKYHQMKGNKYGAYSFGYSEDEYKKLTSITTGVTEKSMIRKWGGEEGLRRWKEYKDKHSYIASKQFYVDKFGKKEGLERHHQDRAITLKTCIKRHGEDKGKEIWDSYCEKQRYTCSLEYFIKQYGKEEGTKKYNNFRNTLLTNLEQECSKSFSRISQELFENLYKKISTYYEDLVDIYRKL